LSTINKRAFDSAFTIDTSKLSRLLTVISERFKDITENPVTVFEATTKKGKNFLASNVEKIINHDNPVNNPITTLSILYKDKKEEPNNLCEISYDKEDSIIKLYVKTEDSRKSKDLFAEVEEQIERSLTPNWVYSLKGEGSLETFRLVTVLLMLPIMIFAIFTFSSQKNLDKSDFLSSKDVAELTKQLSDSEEELNKLDFLYEYHKRKLKNLQDDENPILKFFSKEKIFNIKILLLALPFIIVFGGLYYILWRTYIGSVFLWGDYEEYYNTLLERRKFLWNAVVVALLIGVVANLFVFGFSQYF